MNAVDFQRLVADEMIPQWEREAMQMPRWHQGVVDLAAVVEYLESVLWRTHQNPAVLTRRCCSCSRPWERIV